MPKKTCCSTDKMSRKNVQRERSKVHNRSTYFQVQPFLEENPEIRHPLESLEFCLRETTHQHGVKPPLGFFWTLLDTLCFPKSFGCLILCGSIQFQKCFPTNLLICFCHLSGQLAQRRPFCVSPPFIGTWRMGPQLVSS